MDQSAKVGDRLTDKSAAPEDATIRDGIGQDAFPHWVALRDWIAAGYPGVFTPDWIYGGKRHGWSLRYKKSRAFCTLLPNYRAFAAVVVLGGAERAKIDARRDRLSPRLMHLHDAAGTLHDGTWLKIGIASADDLTDVTDLLVLKRPRRVNA